MAGTRKRVTARPLELELFVVNNVQLTGKTLGLGEHGIVEEVEIPGAKVAAKKPWFIYSSKKWMTDFVEECKLMSQLRHPHIVQFLGVFYQPESSIPALLMEKLETSLDTFLRTTTTNIPVDVKAHLLTGTGRGLVYLHSHSPPIAHCDLTARNILVDSGLTAKITNIARIVTTQSGQLGTAGNDMYMPPETAQLEGTTQNNTAIDIFSFGVVSLFTLTQTFPNNLKPSTYCDQITRNLVARSEIERRQHYIQLMETALGKTHSLVKLTLECLRYDPICRPSAVEVSKQLEEVEKTIPQKTKLELIQQSQSQLREKNAEIARLRGTLQADKAKKQEQIHGLEELTSSQQQQLNDQRKKIKQLSGQLKTLELQPRVEGSRGSKQETLSVASPKSPTVPSSPFSITFNWKRCKDRPLGMNVRLYGQPVALNGKIYIRGLEAVLEYTPGSDQWAELPLPPVKLFTIAILKGQLLVVGGKDKSTFKASNTIFTFDKRSQQWLQFHPPMPMGVASPVVIAYQDYLIVAGGLGDSPSRYISIVNILNTISNKWKIAQPLPDTGCYYDALVQDTVYLVARTLDPVTVLQARASTLTSGALSGVWKTLANTPYYRSSPITIGNTLLTVGGRDKAGNSTASIQMYNPATNQWTVRGIDDLPEPMFDCRCAVLSGKLFVLCANGRVYTTTV